MNNFQKEDKHQIPLMFEEEIFSFREIFYVVQKYKLMLFISLVFSFIMSFIYSELKKPVYVAKTLIMIEDPFPTKINMFANKYSDANYLSNEIQILKSRSLAEKTVKKLFNSKHKNNLFLFGTKKYETNPIQDFLMSEEKPKQIEEIDENRSILFANKIRNSISVNKIKNTDMLNISMKSIDPDEAALLLNTLIDVYSSLELEASRGEMSSLEDFLSIQIEKKEKQLTDSEEQLRIFQEKEQVFGIDNKSRLLLDNLVDAESKYYLSISESNIIDERKKYIIEQLTEEEKKLTNSVSNSINDRLFALKKEIAYKETELISAITQQGENHQVVRNLKQKLGLLKDNLKLETRELIAQGISIADPIKYRQELMDSVISFNAKSVMLDVKSNEMKKLVDNYQQEISKLPEKLLQFTRLKRNINIYSDTYSLMRQKLEEVLISEASEAGRVRVVDEARPIYKRISPNKKRNYLIGLFLGLSTSIGLAFFREFLDQTIKTIHELQKRNLTILSLIPSIGKGFKYQKNRYQQVGNAEKIQRRLITHEDPKSPISEAYRSLRTSLMYTKKNRNLSNVILVSSPGPGEGKTTTISNLAITYANLGKKTILLDTDLRKPVIHNVFSISREPGISRLISGSDLSYNNVIKKTQFDNLDVLTSGVIPPNPSEILASNEMDDLLKNLREKYDVILMDAPPLLAVTDAFVCMKYVDQFIMVARSGITEKSGLDRALTLLKQADANLAGVVVNAIDTSNSYYSGYYYNYYNYYYSDEKS